MATSILSFIASAFRGFPFTTNRPTVHRARDIGDWSTFGPTLSGSDYLGIPAVFAATRLIAEGVASLPIHLFQKSGDDGRSRDMDHPVARLFAEPNDTLTGSAFRELLIRDAVVHGAGYAQIERDGNGFPCKLHYIPQEYVTEAVDQYFGTPVYKISSAWHAPLSGEDIVLPDCDTLVIRSFAGQGLVEACSESLELTQAAQLYAIKLFQNGARPGGVLTHPGRLSDDARQRLRASWERLHGGVERSFSTALLEEGITFQPVSGNANDAQLDQLRNYQAQEVCRIFGIPPSKLFLSGSGGYASQEQEAHAFVGTCLRPWAIRFEQEADRKLLLREERKTHYWQINFEGMLRSALLERYKSYSIARNWSILSPNEIRKLENLPPVEGGDQLLSPVNMAPLDPTLAVPGARAPASGDAADAVDAIDQMDDVGNEQPGQPGILQPQADTTPATDQQPQQDVQAAALNGAQVTALVDLALKVAGGLLPKPAAIAIAKAAFPLVGDATIAAIFGNIKELTPEELAAGNLSLIHI
jgi:HK97 family phage portal protein